MHTNEPFYRFEVFQIPAFLAVAFCILALLVRLLGWFTPTVAIHIALDLSSSTYGEVMNFGKPGTVMVIETESVKEYARRNESLPSPNLISVSGFADQVIPITTEFSSNAKDIETAIDQAIQPSLVSQIGGGTNLDVTVGNSISQFCRGDNRS